MRKKFLEKRMLRLKAKKQTLTERCNASTDAAEVRELTEQLDEVNVPRGHVWNVVVSPASS